MPRICSAPLEIYRAIEAQSPRTTNTLVMGPWSHGGWMRRRRAARATCSSTRRPREFYRERSSCRSSFTTSRGKDDSKLPKAYVFETGHQPVAQARRLAAQGRVGADAVFPGRRQAVRRRRRRGPGAFDEYVSDPAKPVPFTDETSARHDLRTT